MLQTFWKTEIGSSSVTPVRARPHLWAAFLQAQSGAGRCEANAWAMDVSSWLIGPQKSKCLGVLSRRFFVNAKSCYCELSTCHETATRATPLVFLLGHFRRPYVAQCPKSQVDETVSPTHTLLRTIFTSSLLKQNFGVYAGRLRQA